MVLNLSQGRHFVLFSLLLLTLFVHASVQSVQFAALPSNLQLYQRDVSDSATVNVAGSVSLPGQDSIVLSVCENGMAWQRQAQPLTYAGGQAAFKFSGFQRTPLNLNFRWSPEL